MNSIQKLSMKRHFATLLVTAIAGLAQAGADIGSGTLTLVPATAIENRLTVTITANASGITASDSDTTDVSGTLSAELNTDPTGATSEFTLQGGNLAMTDMDFNLRALGFISVATINTSGMGGTATTITPPGLVTPSVSGGTFDASLHRMLINEGAITGELTIPGDPVVPINENFATSPVEGTGSGTGSLTVTPGTVTETHRLFAVTMTLPVDFTDNQTISGTPVTIRVQGTIKATGTIAVPIVREIARWTFDTGTTSTQRLAASNFSQASPVSGLAFNTSFTDFGLGVAPSGSHDGFGFGVNSGDNVIILKRANYFNNSAVPNPRPTTEDYSSWGGGAGVGTGANLSAIGNAPIAFTVSADALATVTVASLTVDFTSGSDIIFQFQEAGAPVGTGVTLRSSTPLATIPLAAPIEIGPGQTKTFTININSGSLNSSHNVDSISVNGMIAAPPFPTSMLPMGKGAATTADLKISFHESVQKGSGSIRLFRANGTLVQTIPINDPSVTISDRDVTIPITDLDHSTSYYVTIDTGAIIDLFGNAYVGISNSTTWAFTTAITVFSNFSESGNLLVPSATNTREQNFTPSGTSVTVTTASGSNVGQETYLTDEFGTLTAGYRISLDLTAVTFNTIQAAQTIGLAVASTETPNNQTPNKRANILVWGWRYDKMYVSTFDATGEAAGNAAATPAYPASGRPDSVFIERTATGWTLGSIKDGIETIFYPNITQVVGATTKSITADGTAFGLWSDMRLTSATWTVSNLVVTPSVNTFSNWIANPAFGIAPADRDLLDDPDNDNLPNGVEAWLGSHPGQFSAGLSGISNNETTTTFTHPRNANLPDDLTGYYEWSPNLVNWYDGDGIDGPVGGPTVNITSATLAGTTTVTATASTTVGRLFLRAGVKLN
jgi:predicted enzyme related to lactoylglutathione lyase